MPHGLHSVGTGGGQKDKVLGSSPPSPFNFPTWQASDGRGLIPEIDVHCFIEWKIKKDNLSHEMVSLHAHGGPGNDSSWHIGVSRWTALLV